MSDVSGKKLCELKVADLKEQLEKRELEITGSKAALSERLEKALKEEGKDASTYIFEKDPPKQVVVKEEPVEEPGDEEKTNDELELPVEEGDDDDVIIDEVGEVDEEENVAEEVAESRSLAMRRAAATKMEMNKKKRGKRFCQMQTDLLLSLVMSSNVHKMETNRMKSKVRLIGWESITEYFNASPGVVKRTEKELRDRTSNIRKDLYKLSKYQKLAKCGNHYPPLKPPSISFEFSDVVKKYAVSLKVKLEGILPTDSDRVYETPSTPENILPTNSLDNEIMDPVISKVDTTASLHDEMATSSTSSTPTFSFPSSASQMFAAQRRRRRKRNTEEVLNSNVFGKKSQLLAEENKRRNEENEFRKEWHILCMKIKKEELAIKKKQSEFWSIIINKIKPSSTSIPDIANLAKVMDTTNTINYDISYPPGPFSTPQQRVGANMDISSVDFEYLAQSQQNNLFVQSTDNAGNIKSEDI